ncbi:amidohydrolase [Phycicoccus sp. MAQZ13P-2]|uniref:amidohydrolase n=1 Tax=Phycicoccus mangrovi TaxID=2840470 RepID=UPI001BFFF700|nr:amidohydrolase [Phycicoccus mangrovi]MBT9257596.1 amidohydrolase [Phycicoccus mangrovi]MBT9276036.1 amidohydrolase [Phycicoccus mangrovi]
MNDDALLAALGERITSLAPELIEIRRDLHAHPELSREETRTTQSVARRLDAAGVAVRLLPGTGVLADLGAAEPVHRIALRADMDALPVRERSGLECSSRTEGVCHACGHDVHTAALVGAVLALHEVEDALADRGIAVRAVFQAAEEVMPGGALDAITAGALEGVDSVFAVHCDPSIDVGQVGLREGALTAAADQVHITLHGRGGHTSRPQLTEDLVFALAKVITDVPAVLGRRLDPRTGAALVWGSVQAGRVANVIPSSGECRGTLRMLDAESWHTVGPLLEEIVHGVVQPYGVKAQVERVKGVPPVVNTADGISALRRGALAGRLTPVPTAQSLGGEDFAWYLDHASGAMARLGTRTPGGPTYDLHQGDLVVDERAIALGARLLATAAVVRGLDARRQAPKEES